VTAAEIERDLAVALARLEADEDDATAAEVARLVDLATDKGAALAHVIRRAAVEAEQAKARAARATARRNKAESVEQWARMQLAALATLAGGRLRGDDYSATVRAGVSAVKVLDARAIPAELTKTQTVTEPDKAAIRERILAGHEVPGCVLVASSILTLR
jgi:hypothetical protein